MAKKMEDMTRDEILREFEGATEYGRVRRRSKRLVPLTIRVDKNLVNELEREAKKRGFDGHTTAARALLEEAVRRPRQALAKEIAEAVVQRLRHLRKAG